MVPVPPIQTNYICPNCKAQNQTSYNYCYNCGVALNQPIVLKICPKCKTRIVASAKFCPECGLKQSL